MFLLKVLTLAVPDMEKLYCEMFSLKLHTMAVPDMELYCEMSPTKDTLAVPDMVKLYYETSSV